MFCALGFFVGNSPELLPSRDLVAGAMFFQWKKVLNKFSFA
jgi:hypothetical protein